jgi:aerobic-type carbon monoxide dehydrogenase small subunit (CoxS/CutS family)
MELIVNGSKHEVEIEPDTPLLWALRDELGMTGFRSSRRASDWCARPRRVSRR